jgi:hypothetical protein
MALHPELNGKRVQKPGHPEVYLIVDGQKRHIPDRFTYNRLFRDSNGIIQDPNLNQIDSGPAIYSGALLAKGPGTDPVWFVDAATRLKRRVASPAAMDKYHFDWGQIESVSIYVLDAIISGFDLE